MRSFGSQVECQIQKNRIQKKINTTEDQYENVTQSSILHHHGVNEIGLFEPENPPPPLFDCPSFAVIHLLQSSFKARIAEEVYGGIEDVVQENHIENVSEGKELHARGLYV